MTVTSAVLGVSYLTRTGANDDPEDGQSRGLLKFNSRLKKFMPLAQVPYIGHLLTREGLRVDPKKVEAIEKMPAPKDAKAVQRLLGSVNYLAKFVPHLSNIMQPLRRLLDKNTEWCWLHTHQQAFDEMKKALTMTPALSYYDVMKPVVIQCDASDSGLGAALLQNGLPVAYSSRSLTSAEINYAQIEKELLAIVFACEKFDQYVYGRDKVHVQSDHKPLEVIFKRPLVTAPKRLQRMLLRLQRYSLDICSRIGDVPRRYVESGIHSRQPECSRSHVRRDRHDRRTVSVSQATAGATRCHGE